MKVKENPQNVTIAMQKSGRLTEQCLDLFKACGFDFELRKDKLSFTCKNFPLTLLMLRDDDIPAYVSDGICDLGIVGENIIEEKVTRNGQHKGGLIKIYPLGFAECRLSIAVPDTFFGSNIDHLQGKRIATSYPNALGYFLQQKNIEADIVYISGSVEIAPSLQIADGICDLVSTGSTLRSNGLKEICPILESQAVLIQTDRPLNSEKMETIARITQRIEGAIKARKAKYIMMNAPSDALEKISQLLPGMEHPSVIPLKGTSDIAIHAVSREEIFWETMEQLKALGARSILVVPIEKIID
jgi:ATP phosphoribosyltransferase